MVAGLLAAIPLAMGPVNTPTEPPENRPPIVHSERFGIDQGEFHRFYIRAEDPDGDSLSYRVTGLPTSAVLNRELGTIAWRPGPGDVGQHLWKLEVSDGRVTTHASFEIEVRDAGRAFRDAEWSAWLLPGLGYSYYRPRRADVWGTFHGPRLQLSLGSWIHQTDTAGPSHGTIHLRVDLQRSTEAGVPVLFGYAGGFSLSFERNPKRAFLVPFYALEFGGLLHDDLGHRWELSPALGVHLLARQGLFVTAQGGYKVVPTRMTELAGWHASLLLQLGWW